MKTKTEMGFKVSLCDWHTATSPEKKSKGVQEVFDQSKWLANAAGGSTEKAAKFLNQIPCLFCWFQDELFLRDKNN